MSGEKYILTIHNCDIFKEVNLSDDSIFLKIGTTQDCNVRLKRELFEIPVCISVWPENGKWQISCDDTLFIDTPSTKDSQKVALHHGDILNFYDSASKQLIFNVSFSYDFTANSVNYDTIIDIRSLNKITIGGSPSAQIRLSSQYVGSELLTLSRKADGSLNIDPSDAPKSATLNGNRIFAKTSIYEYDFIGIADHSFYFKNGVLYTSMRNDIDFVGVSAQPLREETPAFDYPKLNRSPRMLYSFKTDPIEILNPPQKPEKPKDNLVLQLSPALLMIAVTVVTRSGIIEGLGTGNPAFLIFSLATMAVGIVTSVLSFIYNRKQYKLSLEQWNSDYTAYIAKKRREIEEEQQSERLALMDVYPAAEDIRNLVKTFSGRLFERSPKDEDFLFVRIGLGPIPAIRKISCRQEEHIKIDNELMMIPEQMCVEYENLKDAPVLLHLPQSGAVGVVGPESERYDFFKNLLLDICVEHSYEEVQIVVLIPPQEREKYEWIKWIPHIKSSGGDCRGIVCDDESRDDIFETLYAMMTQRYLSAGEDNASITPFYVVFVLEEYGIKTHPLSQYMGSLDKTGMSFIYFKEYKESLPKECAEIVELTNEGGVLRLSRDKAFSCQFTREHINDTSIQFVAERLAPVYCEKIALSSRLTANITLFDLLNIISPENLDLAAQWKASNVQRSLLAPLGVDVKGGKVFLDLHEKAHGPHGLVAGTTGSGKSEIMQSYILSVATKFHPYEVSFVIIDFKGGGMANQFENLPHLIGKITDIDSHEINRSLLSIRAELEKRKRLFAQCGVNHIDQYIGKFRSGEAFVALPHLILIVDEFAELKAEQPEFMKELISTARVGRSLGIHLILATQKPAGQVNEQIWSNSRFKLCLKVATKEDSTEVLRSPLASEIREPGRAYLQVGNNEVFTLFQSAYSGASALSDRNGSTREFKISEVSFTGQRKTIYERKATRTNDGSKLTQLKAIVDYIDKYCQEAGIERLSSICLPPLPQFIDYKSDGQSSPMTSTVKIGIYDDPANQAQPDVTIDFSSGNIMIIGAAQTGKTMLLQTLLRRIAEQYTPEEFSIYILDFGSKVLKIFENMNHVGGVLTDSDDERLKNFFKMMIEEVDKRKDAFSQLGVSSYEAYLGAEDEKPFPRILVVIDNLAAFKETCQEYEDELLNLCREGLALGITLAVTAKQTAGLSYRYMGNFATRISFNCTESSEYSNVFDRCQIRPQNFQGRGLVSIQKVVYEFQAVLPFDGIIDRAQEEVRRSESRRIEQTKAFISEIAKKCGNIKAKAIPEIPATLTNDYWNDLNYRFDRLIVPIGLTYNEIEPVALDLIHVGSLGIIGREGFGKSNLVRTIMNYLQTHVFDFSCEAYLIDSYDRQLKEFETFGFVEQLSIDCGDFEEIVQIFSDKAHDRIEMLRAGDSLENQPLMLCIIQNQQIFAPGAVTKAVSDRFKKLLSDGKQVKMCFIFSNLENNGEFSASDMVKITRELGQYILLEDLTNIKLFGAGKFTPADLRQFRKQLLLGDGYVYNARDGLEKIKLVKTDKRE